MDSELAVVIEESKERLAEEPPVEVKKRGRKKGGKNKPKEDAPKVDSEASEAVKAMIVPAHISSGFQFLGRRAALNTGFQGFEVPKEEADHLAGLADACIRRYMPNLSDGHALLAVTLFSFGMAIGGRYLGYQDYLRSHGKHPDQKPAPTVQEENAREREMSGVSASQFFPKSRS